MKLYCVYSSNSGSKPIELKNSDLIFKISSIEEFLLKFKTL